MVQRGHAAALATTGGPFPFALFERFEGAGSARCPSRRVT